MAGDENHIVAKRPQAFADRRQQGIEIAAGKVSTPDRALKQHIADKCHGRGSMEEHHVTGSMARAMQHFQGLVADRHLIAVSQPAVGLECRRVGKTEHGALLRQVVEPVFVRPMRPDNRNLQLHRQFRRSTDMVDMAVRQQQADQL